MRMRSLRCCNFCTILDITGYLEIRLRSIIILVVLMQMVVVCGLKYDGHVVCVNHDVYSGIMHRCHGLCEQGHGWNYDSVDATKYLELISHTPEISIQTIDELL